MGNLYIVAATFVIFCKLELSSTIAHQHHCAHIQTEATEVAPVQDNHWCCIILEWQSGYD